MRSVDLRYQTPLSYDGRHQVFVDMVRSQAPKQGGEPKECPPQTIPGSSYRTRDIPVYASDLASAW